ncbi:MAG: cytochrome c-type biogenesis protein CcmH [Gammaproteobacteria bacterium]
MRRASLLSLPALLLTAVLAHAVVETYDFSREEDRARYQRFTYELRCPKCQNQNLADSNAPIAADLRRELHRLLEEGQSDEEIVDFMVQRYGEYVLYRPRLEPRTWLLWGAPAGMLLGGVFVMAGMLRRSRGAPPAALDAAERTRLAGILGKENDRS